MRNGARIAFKTPVTRKALANLAGALVPAVAAMAAISILSGFGYRYAAASTALMAVIAGITVFGLRRHQARRALWNGQPDHTRSRDVDGACRRLRAGRR